MAKTITITDEMEDAIVNVCYDELNYHINESGCPDEYELEIKTQIEMLRLLGHNDLAESYENQFNAKIQELSDDEY